MKLEIGQKVKIPKTKLGEENYYSIVVNDAKNKKQDFLYYNGEEKGYHMLNDYFDYDDLDGDFFNLNEIELYEEKFPEKWCLKITKESFPYTQKAYEDLQSFSSHTQFNYNYLKSDHSFASRSIKNPSKEYPEITLEQFKKHILKESTTMKNLLETEFVIENCTLPQRLAIKAYCDEKKIKVNSDFEDFYYPNVCYNKEFDVCNSEWSKDKIKITFSEFIQFLDNYQPEPEFKVGDHIFFLKEFDDNKIGEIGCITSFINEDYYNNDKDVEVKAKGWINYSRKNHQYLYGGFRWEGNGYFAGKDFRLATPEEIKKWKEENEIKLPAINGHNGAMTAYDGPNDTLSWGCTSISLRTVKELLKLGVIYIGFGGHREASYDQIQQIKKFIEHNKL